MWAALMCDFESAEISSFRDFALDELHLPIFNIEGCHMHYCSAIIKHIKDLGLAAAYKDADYLPILFFFKKKLVGSFIFSLPIYGSNALYNTISHSGKEQSARRTPPKLTVIEKYYNNLIN